MIESRPLSRAAILAEQLAKEVARLTYDLRVAHLSPAIVADAGGTEDEDWTVNYLTGEMTREVPDPVTDPPPEPTDG